MAQMNALESLFQARWMQDSTLQECLKKVECASEEQKVRPIWVQSWSLVHREECSRVH